MCVLTRYSSPPTVRNFHDCKKIRQADFSQLELPMCDYITDLKSVLDQSIRIIQVMIDICKQWLAFKLNCLRAASSNGHAGIHFF
ncbi:hypothetical protein L6164_011237 [Bauhinia variegata]|uniref:Uncharacterized protein n=1 Tax=Bauhinia variegata TaxID=167791 RepID=A0ACB9P608_BAUVA|nr:hypothetical protein L6164_011237 [Bauhinia variegata]